MSHSNTLLEKIVLSKKEEVSSSKFRVSFKEIKNKARDAMRAMDFAAYLKPSFRGALPATRVIAEIKKASPSGGLICPVFDPVKIAEQYLEAGAAALSVLTDQAYFQGSLKDLTQVRKVSPRPLLRKDFMIDEYQIYEARAYGADCILGIVAILEKSELEDFCGLASQLGMATLVEVHDEKELELALNIKGGALQELPLLGINNRNLNTLVTDLAITEKLISKIASDRIVVSESGLKNRADIERLQKAGAKAFLMGEHLLREKDLKGKLREILGE